MISQFRVLILCAIAGLILGACAKSSPAINDSNTTDAAPLGGYHAETLKAESCPDGMGYADPTPIKITAKGLPLADRAENTILPEGVRFHGGWHLTSDNENFGGLSGIDITAAGDFLMVSDAGAFVWLERSADGAPNQTGNIAYMKGASGQLLQGKSDADSEGLALQNGLALVSFERTHRIEAFDLDGCGANARAALVTRLPSRLDGKAVHENRGPEALALRGALIAGYEQSFSDTETALFSIEEGNRTAQLSAMAHLPNPYDGPLTGMSNTIDGIGYAVRRRYSPATGNRITVEMSVNDGDGRRARALFDLSRPQTVDNFEGITAETLSNGMHRVWLISDDNFSARQRTLLFAFDVDATNFNTPATQTNTQ